MLGLPSQESVKTLYVKESGSIMHSRQREAMMYHTILHSISLLLFCTIMIDSARANATGECEEATVSHEMSSRFEVV